MFGAMPIQQSYLPAAPSRTIVERVSVAYASHSATWSTPTIRKRLPLARVGRIKCN
jgi:hypothetical protein